MGRDNPGNKRSSRGGRGRGSSNNYRNRNSRSGGSSKAGTTKEIKFTPNAHGKSHGATYATVKDAVIQYVQKTYKGGYDIAKCLKTGKKIDLDLEEPIRKISTDTDADQKKLEQEGFDIKYSEELSRHGARVDNLKEGLYKAYALIFTSYCTKTMQSRIEEHPDFETKLQDDPMALLEAIKTLMRDPVRAQYPLVSMTEAIADMVNYRQKEEESLLDYVKGFKQQRDVMTARTGTHLLDDFVEQSVEYQNETDTTKRTELKNQAFDQWMAYLLIRGSDQSKYGSLMKGFTSQFSLGNDQYPRTIQAATDVLSNHKLDAKYYENRQRSRDKQRQEQRQERSEPDPNTAPSFGQVHDTYVCYCCGARGKHPIENCPKKGTIPRSEWHANKAISALQSNDNESNNDLDDDASVQSTSTLTTTSSRNRRSEPRQSSTRHNNDDISWSGSYQGFQGLSIKQPIDTQLEFVNKQTCGRSLVTNLDEVILLDCGSTIYGTIKNPNLLYDIRVSNRPLGMATNAGKKQMNLEGTITGHTGGPNYFDPDQMANIFGFAPMIDEGHRITYDSDIEDAFTVYRPCGDVIKFTRTPEGLYAYKPIQRYYDSVAAKKNMLPPTTEEGTNLLVSTLSENRKGYSQRQFDDAKRARRLYHILQCPSVPNFKHLLRQNLIKNCPVTTKDVTTAERIFGPDIGTLKGKSTRPKPPRVRDDSIEIPPEILDNNRKLTHCMDLMFVNGDPIYTSIDRDIKYRAAVPLNSQTAKELYRATDKVFRKYNHQGYEVEAIHCDRQFKVIMDDVKDDLDVHMNYTSTSEHVPEAERNNRSLAERMRCTYHNLPYKAIPRVMTRALAEIVADSFNIFPAKGGVSPYFSPAVIMGEPPLDYDKHCQVPFGTYVQAYTDNNPKNTQKARTFDAIYLRPSQNRQPGHEVMDLSTGRVQYPLKVTEIPVTDIVIKAVEAMAAKQGITSLKIQNRNKTIFYPTDWIAGVDYEEPDPDLDDNDYKEETTDYKGDEELDDDEAYDRIDQDEIDELLAEPGPETDDTTNPTDAEEPQPDDETFPGPVEPPPADETPTDSARPTRSAASRSKPDIFVSHTEFHQQKNLLRNVKFADAEWWKLEHCHNLITQDSPNPDNDAEYTPDLAMIVARVMTDINSKATTQGANFAQQYILQKGLKKFGVRGSEAAHKEVDQLHRRTCFTPIDISTLTSSEKRKAMEALMFLTEKRDGSVKGRMVYNGKPTREWLSREDTASPTAALESIMLTALIDAHENRDVMTNDVPNAFIQTHMPPIKDGEERVVMKITGVLIDLLVDIAPEVYGPYVVFENERKVLYVQVLKALYGMLMASLLWYKKFRNDLEQIDYVFNPYDPCVANKIINGKQHTIRFHVDDLMCSHVNKRVNDNFHKWLNEMYGSYGEVKATRGRIHDYLGMTFDFSQPGKVLIDMIDYIESMVDDFSIPFTPGDTAPTPAADNLFAAGTTPLDKKRSEEFHTFVAKGLFACKRARPDIHIAIALLCTRTKQPTHEDWEKLIRLLKFCNGTRKDKLILSAENLRVIKWMVDTSFAVHPDFKSHTGGTMSFGKGSPITVSRKQKLNTRSSTEAELVGADDVSIMILWTRLFMEAQGYGIDQNILYQDNKSTILLEQNGKRSSSKRTRAFNIRYFFLTDQVEKGNLKIEYCPTTEMIGDYMTKPLQGQPFKKFRKEIMGH